MITKEQFSTLDDLFDYYNQTLFKGGLNDCIVNMSRKGGTYGFFAQDRWRGEGKKVHEISINPDYLNRPDKEWHSTLVHEMVHLWQADNGKPSRSGYHNSEWTIKMEEIGLMPTHNGMPGGKKTGQNMTHYPIEGGAFEKAFNNLSEDALKKLRLKYLPAVSFIPDPTVSPDDNTQTDDPEGKDAKTEKNGKRIKYTCGCGNNVWGRAELELSCKICNEDFIPQS